MPERFVREGICTVIVPRMDQSESELTDDIRREMERGREAVIFVMGNTRTHPEPGS